MTRRDGVWGDDHEWGIGPPSIPTLRDTGELIFWMIIIIAGISLVAAMLGL